MEHATQVDLGRRILGYLDARSTALADDVFRNPVAAYTCPERLERERALFRRLPLLAAFSSDVERPGDYLAGDHAGTPMALIRAESGDARAFANVCRHRGARVLDGRGRVGRTFACSYHGWTYDRSGALAGVPAAECFAGAFGEDGDGRGLVPLPTSERDGLVWVVPAPGAALDLDDHLGALARELASYGFAEFRHYATRVLRPRINWKLAVDTFLEAYHLHVLHPGTVAPIFCANLATFDAFGRSLRMLAVRRSIEALRGQPEAEWNLIPHTAVIYVLFPNTVFIVQGGHVELWRAWPGEQPDACVVDLSLYTPEPVASERADRHYAANLKLALDTVAGEDFPLAETMQRGFASGAQTEILYGRNEPSLAHFHRGLVAALDRGAGGAGAADRAPA